jgi:hypothetical protein
MADEGSWISDLSYWVREYFRVVRYGMYGYRPQPQPPPPRCESTLLASGSVAGSHTGDYFVFWSGAALANARAKAAMELNNAMHQEDLRLRLLFRNSCIAPCSLDIRWARPLATAETVSPSGPPYTATVALSQSYEVHCV